MYSGMYWVNQNIPKGSNIIIMNRPISLYKEFSFQVGLIILQILNNLSSIKI